MRMLKVLLVFVVCSCCVGSVMGATAISNPSFLIGNESIQEIAMNLSGANLMERVDGNDVIVEKGNGEYYIFLCKVVEGNLVFGGYMSTDNYRNITQPGYEGWCLGLVNRTRIPEGESVDCVIIMYDDDGGRFALQDPGVLVFDDNLVIWEGPYKFFPGSGNIEYDGVIDGFLDFVFGIDSFYSIIVDSFTLVPLPLTLVSPFMSADNVDPNTALVWGNDEGFVYDVYLYTDVNSPELFASAVDGNSVSVNLEWDTTYYWRVDKVMEGEVVYSTPVWNFKIANYECSENIVGDLNGDCKVDFIDFAMMTSSWLVEVEKVPAN